MNVRGRIVLSVGGLSLALGGVLLACSSTNNNYPPGESTSGQSCAQTEDCKSPLVCVDNVCEASATTTTPTTDASMGGDGAGGDAGTTTATGPHLGLAGESCQTSKDCSTGLDCVATDDFGSVCEVVSLGLTPTGKTCGGQCNAASDCCELPIDVPSLEYETDAGGFSLVNVHSCQDVLTALGGSSSTCLSGSLNSFQKTACFYYETYCDCASGTWTCSTSHACQYTAGCTLSAANTVNGCPSANRVTTGLTTTCTIPTGQTSGTCGTPPSCTTASDCNGKPVTDTSGAVCTNGNCTCYNSGCYLTCQGNLDCPGGYTCDSTTSLCKAAGCAMSADCVTSTGNTTAVCVSGACKIPCSTDYQCNAGATGDAPTTFSGNVCSSGYCAPLGCSSDNDCTSGGVNTFCVTPTPAGERSAITGTGSSM
jgi:hypothetical protein